MGKYYCHSQNLIQTRRKWSTQRIRSEKTEAIPVKWHFRQKVTPKLTPKLSQKPSSAYIYRPSEQRESSVIFSPLGASLCGKYLVQSSHQQNFIKYPVLCNVLSTALNQSAAIFLKMSNNMFILYWRHLEPALHSRPRWPGQMWSWSSSQLCCGVPWLYILTFTGREGMVLRKLSYFRGFGGKFCL